MSLLRLLTTGNSLDARRANASRYRVTRQRLLPHFGSAENPFRSQADSAPGRTGVLAPEGGGPHDPTEARRDVPGLSSDRVSVFPGRAKDQVVSNSASSQRWWKLLRFKTVRLLSGWKAKMGAVLAPLWGKAAKPAIPRFTERPMQSQLSLERIKVVRNDLRESDVEVVTAGAPGTRESAVLRSQGNPASVQESILGRVATRVIGASKPQSHEGR